MRPIWNQADMMPLATSTCTPMMAVREKCGHSAENVCSRAPAWARRLPARSSQAKVFSSPQALLMMV